MWDWTGVRYSHVTNTKRRPCALVLIVSEREQKAGAVELRQTVSAEVQNMHSAL